MSDNVRHKEKLKRICFRVDEQLLEFIDMLAEYLGVNRSECIRIILNTVRMNLMMNRPLFLFPQIFKFEGEKNEE